MFNYHATIQTANAVAKQASELRVQAQNMNSLLGIVGISYAGKDAQVYYNATRQAQNELQMLAARLDRISAQIRSAAEAIREEERTNEEGMEE